MSDEYIYEPTPEEMADVLAAEYCASIAEEEYAHYLAEEQGRDVASYHPLGRADRRTSGDRRQTAKGIALRGLLINLVLLLGIGLGYYLAAKECSDYFTR